MCVGIKVKGLQDTVSFAMGTVGEHIGMGAPHTHFCAQQNPQCPGQSMTTQSCDMSIVSNECHNNGWKQGDGKCHEPHVKRCEEDSEN